MEIQICRKTCEKSTIIITIIYWWYNSKRNIANLKQTNNANWSTRKLFEQPYTCDFLAHLGKQSSYLWRHDLVVSNYW